MTIQIESSGRIVNLVKGEQAECNHASLINHGGSLDGMVPFVAPTECIYTSQGVSAVVAFDPPNTPRIFAPLSGEKILRSSNMQIKYEPDGAQGVQVIPSDVTGSHGGSILEPDSGSYINLDISQMQKGTGSITFYRVYAPLFPTPFGFKKATLRMQAEKNVTLVWY